MEVHLCKFSPHFSKSNHRLKIISERTEDETNRTLSSGGDGLCSDIRYGEDFTASKDEERIIPLTALNKLKGLFRSHPIKASEVKATNFKKSDANEALDKVKSVFGFKKTPTKVTQAKVKDIQAYARDNPNKWEAMTYYLSHYWALEFVLVLVGGAFYYAWTQRHTQ